MKVINSTGLLEIGILALYDVVVKLLRGDSNVTQVHTVWFKFLQLRRGALKR